MKTTSRILLLFFILASVSISCKKSPTQPTQSSSDPNVFLSGYRSFDQALYWNNGKQIDLGRAFNTTDIALSGPDVYTIGNIGYALPAGGSANAAVYWKNGVMTRLGNDPSYANSICVSGSDIYICGNAMVNNEYVAVYWKNGAIQTLGNIPYSKANYILSAGPDLYVAGAAGSLGSTAVYWKNGNLVELEDGSATGLFVKSTDLYVCGNTSDGAVYWKNGVKSVLYNPASVIQTSATGIAVSDHNIYVAGYFNKIDAVLWKDGELIKLNNPVQAMNLTDNKNKIILKDTSVYISLNSADYWKDGKIINVGDGNCSSIAVKQ